MSKDTKITEFVNPKLEKLIYIEESLTPSCDNCNVRHCEIHKEESRIKCLRSRAFQYWYEGQHLLFTIDGLLEDKYKGWSDMVQYSFWYDTKRRLNKLKERKKNDKVS